MISMQLNNLQALRLWNHCNQKAKGKAHLQRMERMYRALGLEAIEEIMEQNQKVLEAHGQTLCTECQQRGRAAPPGELHSMKATDPTREIRLENGDFDKLCEYVKEWNDEGHRGEREEIQDFRVQLRILEEIDKAKAALEASKKSEQEVQPSSKTP